MNKYDDPIVNKISNAVGLLCGFGSFCFMHRISAAVRPVRSNFIANICVGCFEIVASALVYGGASAFANGFAGRLKELIESEWVEDDDDTADKMPVDDDADCEMWDSKQERPTDGIIFEEKEEGIGGRANGN